MKASSPKKRIEFLDGQTAASKRFAELVDKKAEIKEALANAAKTP
jgi:hypothetical protein